MKSELQGTAEIITDDIRLLQRILNPIKSLLKKQTKTDFPIKVKTL
jgi:hypothetical protein